MKSTVTVDIDAPQEMVAALLNDPSKNVKWMDDLRLSLDASSVTVAVHGTLSTLPDGRTRLVSEEEFRFKGLWRAAFGVLAWSAIRKAHRRHIESFKRFVEHERRSST